MVSGAASSSSAGEHEPPPSSPEDEPPEDMDPDMPPGLDQDEDDEHLSSLGAGELGQKRPRSPSPERDSPQYDGGTDVQPGPNRKEPKSETGAPAPKRAKTSSGRGHPDTAAPATSIQRKSKRASKPTVFETTMQSALRQAGHAVGGQDGASINAFLSRKRHTTSAAAIRGVHGLARWLLSTELRPADYLEQVRDALELRPRLLVAAPSNAAVDNLVERVAKPGAMLDGTLRPFSPPIVRVGTGVGPAVERLGVSLESQLQGYLGLDAVRAHAGLEHAKRGMAEAAAELERIRRHHRLLADKESAASSGTSGDASGTPAAGGNQQAALQPEIAGRLIACLEAYHLHSCKGEAFAWARLAADRNAASMAARHGARHALGGGGGATRMRHGEIRDNLRMALLDACEIVFTTLSSSAVEALEQFRRERGRRFASVVIDEAGQATESATLIPLREGATRCVLVGDPKQLPATILSPLAAARGLSRSLFARLQVGGHPVHLLDTQYRSHPAISAFPSTHFYGGRVRDAVSVQGAARAVALHALSHFRPTVFFDVLEAGEKGHGGAARAAEPTRVPGAQPEFSASTPRLLEGRSHANPAEARLAVGLVTALRRWRGKAPTGAVHDFKGSVFLLTPYQKQLALLREMHGSAVRLANASAERAARAATQEASPPAGGYDPFKGTSGAPAPQGSDGGPPKPVDPLTQPFPDRPLAPCRVDSSTVDGAQGQERDVVVLSTVRAQPPPMGVDLADMGSGGDGKVGNASHGTVAAGAGVKPGTAASASSSSSSSSSSSTTTAGPSSLLGHAPGAALLPLPAAAVGTATAAAASASKVVTSAIGNGGGSGAPASGDAGRSAAAAAPSASAGDARARRVATIGFVRDVRRMNVALTRARYCCWVVGSARTLRSSPDWEAYLDHMKRAGAVVTVPNVDAFVRAIGGAV